MSEIAQTNQQYIASTKVELQNLMSKRLIWNVCNKNFETVLYGDNVFSLVRKEVECLVNIRETDSSTTLFRYKNLYIIVEVDHGSCGHCDSNLRLCELIPLASIEKRKQRLVKHMKEQLQKMMFFVSESEANLYIENKKIDQENIINQYIMNYC